MDTQSSLPPGDQPDIVRPASGSAGPVMATPVGYQYPPQTIVIHQGGRWSRLFTWIGWTGFLLCVILLFGLFGSLNDYFDTTDGIEERFHSGTKFAGDKIAIISVSGVIMEGDGFARNQIERIRNDESVKAVVVRVDTPGGTVTGSDYIFHHLKKLREEKDIPLIVSMGSIATSGGYYVAMAVGDQPQSIYAEPTTTTGSIGVIIPHYDLSGLLEKLDIRDDSIATHPRKQMLSMTRPIPDDHREILEQYINESFKRFKSVVKEGRPEFRKDESKLDELATGEIFTATQALENGLVDELGFIEDAVARAAELAGLDPEDVRVVEFEEPVTLNDLIGFAKAPSGQMDLKTLLENAAPRAYYLSTSLPPLVTTYGK